MKAAREKFHREYKPYIDRFNKHPYALPVTTFMVLFFLSIAILVGLNATTVQTDETNIIRLNIDGERQRIPSNSDTVGEFIEKAEIELAPNDRVEPSLEAPIFGRNFKVNVYRARPVTIVDKGIKKRAFSSATTARSVAKQAGVKVFPEDRLNSEVPENFLKDRVLGEKVVIDRATPVSLNLYGTPESTRTHADTVGDLLAEKEVKLAKKDKVKPATTTKISSDLQIFVTREGIQIVTKEEEIPMPVEVIEDSSLSFGSEAVRQEGSPGKKTVTYEIKLKNGEEISRRVIQEAIITQPTKQIIARGPQGSFGEALAILRQCESGGNYQINTGNGFYGAYQFVPSTWDGVAPPGYVGVLPNQAPPEIQDLAATTLYQRSGWGPWPGCTAKYGLQDVYR